MSVSVLDVLHSAATPAPAALRSAEEVLNNHRDRFPLNRALLRDRSSNAAVAPTVRRAVNAVVRSLDAADVTVETTNAYSADADVIFRVTFDRSGAFHEYVNDRGRAVVSNDRDAALVQQLLLDQGVPAAVTLDRKAVIFTAPTAQPLTEMELSVLELDAWTIRNNREKIENAALIFDRYNVSLDHAVGFAVEQFHVDDDQDWIASSLSGPAASQFRRHRFTAPEARQWSSADFYVNATDARLWADAGVSPQDASRWVRVTSASSFPAARQILSEGQLEFLLNRTSEEMLLKEFPHVKEMLSRRLILRAPRLREFFSGYLSPIASAAQRAVTDDEVRWALLWATVIHSAGLAEQGRWVNPSLAHEWATSGLTPIEAAKFIFVENVIRSIDGKKMLHIGPTPVQRIAATYGTAWKRLRQYETDNRMRLVGAHQYLKTMTVDSDLKRSNLDL